MHMALPKCPFCGGEGEIVRGTNLKTVSETYHVSCKKCKCKTDECTTIADAIMKWSARNEKESNDEQPDDNRF